MSLPSKHVSHDVGTGCFRPASFLSESVVLVHALELLGRGAFGSGFLKLQISSIIKKPARAETVRSVDHDLRLTAYTISRKRVRDSSRSGGITQADGKGQWSL
jgi:hypothetical protein